MSLIFKYYAACRYAECHYAECRYAECRYAECRGAVGSVEIISTIFHRYNNNNNIFAQKF